MTVGVLSCWNKDCPIDCNENFTCVAHNVACARACRSWKGIDEADSS